MAKKDGQFERVQAGELLDMARDDLIESIRLAKHRMWLASPFLSKSVAELIAEAAIFSGAPDKRMLTALSADSVRRGSLNTKGLGLLLASGSSCARSPTFTLRLRSLTRSGD